MRRADRGRRNAFTLIELVIVIVIMAFLASLAVISLGGTMDRYQLSRASETIERFDARARRDARTSRKSVQATIQRHRQQLLIESPGRQDARFRLPAKVEISNIRLRRRVTAGSNFEIRFSREGRSPTYAVELRRGEMSRWLVILGTSGQVIPIDKEGEVDAILSL